MSADTMAEHAPVTWRSLLDEATSALPVRSDARRIVERASGLDGPDLLLALDEPVPTRVLPFFGDLVERRRAGEPLQYVLGQWGFRHLDLLVDRRVLIPRPETEQVVEHALDALRALGLGRPPTCVDLGTGSGAIALSLATEVPGATVWAVDRSSAALSVARANVAGVGGMAATRIRVVEGSWFEPLPDDLVGSVDLIVANPPYVGEDERADLDESVLAWEPDEALFAGQDGFDDIAHIVAAAPRWLARPGVLVVELAPRQAAAATTAALEAGAMSATVEPDLAGRARALVAVWRA